MLLRSVRSSLASLLSLGALALAGSSASAAPIAVFSTGVTNSGALAAEGTADLHYTLTSTPSSTAPTSAPAFVSQNRPSPWVGNTATSQWISPAANGGAFQQSGNYSYTTTFSLAGLVSSTAAISGSLASDDSVTIFLNGVNKGSFAGLSSLLAFSITSGFVDGLNTLTFTVFNNQLSTNNPTGLQVNIASATAAVPEPASALMLGLGGVAAAGFGLRRRRAAV